MPKEALAVISRITNMLTEITKEEETVGMGSRMIETARQAIYGELIDVPISVR